MEDLRLLAATDRVMEEEILLLSIIDSDRRTFEKNFDLERLTEEECKLLFRFEKADIHIVFHALRIPDKVICPNGIICSGLEGLCILLRRLAYPNRLSDIGKIFGRPDSALSFIINNMLEIIFSNHSHLLADLNRSWLSNQSLDELSHAVQMTGAPLPKCWGFIDGTVRPICRPSRNQRIVFNGHKRVHALKYQSIVLPNGIIANMFGPIEGRRHDAGLLRESCLYDQLERHMTTPAGDAYVLYGDPAYPLSTFIITPYHGRVISAQQALFNKKMSAVRTCVEWAFGKILSLFSFLDYKKNQKLYLQPVGKYFLVASILTNCHTCLYGSETGMYFGLEPPTLQEYLAG